MTRVVVILDEEGKYQSALSSDEIDIKIFKRGENDAAIDRAESELEVLEIVCPT